MKRSLIVGLLVAVAVGVAVTLLAVRPAPPPPAEARDATAQPAGPPQREPAPMRRRGAPEKIQPYRPPPVDDAPAE